MYEKGLTDVLETSLGGPVYGRMAEVHQGDDVVCGRSKKSVEMSQDQGEEEKGAGD